MRTRNKYALSALLLTLLPLTGCDWKSDLYENYVEETEEEGKTEGHVQFCMNDDKELDYILLKDKTECTLKDVTDANKSKICGEFSDAFEYKICPKNYVCQKDENAYCVYSSKCSLEQYECNDNGNIFCIDPTYIKTCGAESCFKQGMDCSLKKQICDKDTRTCVCPKGYFLCDDQCVLPENTTYCGINENCNGDTRSGQDCSKLPNAIYTCQQSKDDYQCLIAGCPINTNYCIQEDSSAKCIPRNDIKNCGNCNINCLNEIRTNAKGVDCGSINSSYACKFECINNTENCGDEFSPLCIDTNNDFNNCGKCGNACNPGERCVNKKCIQTTCADSQCQTTDNCISEDPTRCGKGCLKCYDSQYCNNEGYCVVDSCTPGEHMYYEGEDGKSVRCVENTPSRCAKSNNKSNSEVIDCTSIDPNVLNYSCDNGECIATACILGYHLTNTNDRCEKDDDNNCGETGKICDTRNVPNSKRIECQAGKCITTECEDGFTLTVFGTCMSPCGEDSHVYQAICENDTIDHCGDHDNKCLQGNDFTTTCVNSLCSYKCKSGYYFNGKSCKKNDNSNCGAPNHSCRRSDYEYSSEVSCNTTKGECQITSCQTGYFLHDNKCYKNNNEHCGSIDNKCNERQTCQYRKPSYQCIINCSTLGVYDRCENCKGHNGEKCLNENNSDATCHANDNACYNWRL